MSNDACPGGGPRRRVGGTLTANLLARRLGRDVHVTVVDPTGMHLYQPGFLYVALGKANGRWLARDERTLLRRDVDLAVEAATLVEPDQGRVRLAHGGQPGLRLSGARHRDAAGP